MSYKLSGSISAFIIASLIITAPAVSLAQELEEVVVTARKRAESLQDVPISVQAIAGERIAEQGIVDIQQLAPYTPNFSYIQAAGASDLYFMRGLGTYGSGIHFEPSVGQVFNGFFSTRSRLGRSALIDMAQVEILKGPQGAIIGKNTPWVQLILPPTDPRKNSKHHLQANIILKPAKASKLKVWSQVPLLIKFVVAQWLTSGTQMVGLRTVPPVMIYKKVKT